MVNPNLDGLDGKCDMERELDPQIQVPTDRYVPTYLPTDRVACLCGMA